MSMNITIRTVQESDVRLITKIRRDLAWFEHLNLEPYEETVERGRPHIALYTADDSRSLYVAENATSEVLGYAAIHLKFAKAERLIVRLELSCLW